MILWMSLASIGVRVCGPKGLTLDFLQMALQVTCVAAASVQAGYMESRRDSALRRPLQAFVLLLFLASVVLNSEAVALGLGLP